MPPTHAAIAAAYIQVQENWWAWEILEKASDDDPELCWQLIQEIISRTDSDTVVIPLGAGPLEDLLSDHGERIIDRAEQLARTNVTFKRCLAAMWRTQRIPEAVWNRIAAATGRSGGAA